MHLDTVHAYMFYGTVYWQKHYKLKRNKHFDELVEGLKRALCHSVNTYLIFCVMLTAMAPMYQHV